MRIPLTLISAGLLRHYHENPVFRREIGLDGRGVIKSGSPLIIVHLVMLILIAIAALLYWLFGWMGPLLLTGAELAAITLLAYPIAFRRGYNVVHRERVRGTLDQLLMTPMTPRELFDGMCDGAALPYYEARPYLWSMAGAFLLSVVGLGGDPIEVALGAAFAMSVALILMNHIRHVSIMGVVSGIKAAAENKALLQGVFWDWLPNPFFYHLWLLARYGCYVALFVFATGASTGWGVDGGGSHHLDQMLPAAALGVLILAGVCRGKLDERAAACRQRLSASIAALLGAERL